MRIYGKQTANYIACLLLKIRKSTIVHTHYTNLFCPIHLFIVMLNKNTV